MTDYEIVIRPREDTTTSIGRCVVCGNHVQDSIPGPRNETDSADYWRTNIGLAQLGPIHLKMMVAHHETPATMIKCHLKCAGKLQDMYWEAEIPNGENLAQEILKYKCLPHSSVVLLCRAKLIPPIVDEILHHWNQRWREVRKAALAARTRIHQKHALEHGVFD